MSSSAPPRSLADQLRSWSDAELTLLLDARPDLASPAPQDSSQLASRASTRASVLRALDELSRLELLVLDAVIALGGRAPLADLLRVVHADAEAVTSAVRRLRDLALLWGTEEDLRCVSAVADTLGTTVSGLGASVEQLLATTGPDRVAALLADLGGAPTGDRVRNVEAVAAVLLDSPTLERLLGECDPAARSMHDHLERSGADGTSDAAAALVTVATATTPVEQLAARGLLLPKDRRHLAVPREVALGRRLGRTTHERADGPPDLVTAERPQRLVDQAAVGAAYELVHRTELLLDSWGSSPPGALRTGGLGVRDLRAVAVLLHTDDRVAALVVEVAAAAGLVGLGSTPEHDAAWLPTDAYDAWRGLPTSQRWARLAEAWLESPRLVGLVGGRLQGKGVNALQPELERGWVVGDRHLTLREVDLLPQGEVLAPGTGVPSLVARVQWLRPRRPSTRVAAVGWLMEEAAVVGILGLGGMASHGSALLQGGPAQAARVVEPLLPRPVDHVLLQADLTAVAPGPLEDRLARDLAMLAQVESRGGATVYRFTESSVRHAFDAGWTAAEVHEALGRVARNEVPQPLAYLIDDVARTFGTLRLGTAEAFLRSDDEAALAALVHDPRAASLRLRRIAPTVVVSDTPVDVLLPRLRTLGLSPVVEAADGTVRVARHDAHRARTPRPVHAGRAEQATRVTARTAATVTALRSGDRAAAGRPVGAPAPRQSPASALALLREAAEGGSTVRIGYVDNDGSSHDRVVDPQRVDGGWLRAFDHRSQEVRSYAVHRINAVHSL